MMFNLISAKRYTPPEIARFRQGLLEEAHSAILELDEEIQHAKIWLDSVAAGEWNPHAGYTHKTGGHRFKPELFKLYGYWQQARTYMSRLAAMREEDRMAHLELDNKRDYDEEKENLRELDARLLALEDIDPFLWQARVNEEMRKTLDYWEFGQMPGRNLDFLVYDYKGDGSESGIAWAEKDPKERPWPEVENEPENVLKTIDEFQYFRTRLEWCALGVTEARKLGAAQMIRGEKRRLPQAQARQTRERLQELDVRFQKLLKGKTVPLEFGPPWLDRTFWWELLAPIETEPPPAHPE